MIWIRIFFRRYKEDQVTGISSTADFFWRPEKILGGGYRAGACESASANCSEKRDRAIQRHNPCPARAAATNIRTTKCRSRSSAESKNSWSWLRDDFVNTVRRTADVVSKHRISTDISHFISPELSFACALTSKMQTVDTLLRDKRPASTAPPLAKREEVSQVLNFD